MFRMNGKKNQAGSYPIATPDQDILDNPSVIHGSVLEAPRRFEAKEVYEAARAELPTKWGNFTIVGFFDPAENREHTAIVKGSVSGKERCVMRIHSQCHTGDVLGSLRCDCQAQLEAGLAYIGKQKFGVLVYLQQEGRGIGLINKIRAYDLQDKGMDTVDANVHLGFPPDARSYDVAGKMVQLLGIRSVRLLTNNPEKIRGMEEAGVPVIERIPLIIDSNKFNENYLDTKQRRMGHLF